MGIASAKRKTTRRTTLLKRSPTLRLARETRKERRAETVWEKNSVAVTKIVFDEVSSLEVNVC